MVPLPKRRRSSMSARFHSVAARGAHSYLLRTSHRIWGWPARAITITVVVILPGSAPGWSYLSPDPRLISMIMIPEIDYQRALSRHSALLCPLCLSHHFGRMLVSPLSLASPARRLSWLALRLAQSLTPCSSNPLRHRPCPGSNAMENHARLGSDTPDRR